MSGSAAPAGSDQNAASAALEEEFPEDPRLAGLRRLVTYLLVVLIVGISAVVIALLLKLKEIRFDAPAPAAVQQTIPGVRPGERLVSANATVERVTLLLEDAQGRRRAVVLDGRSFQPLVAASDAAGAGDGQSTGR